MYKIILLFLFCLTISSGLYSLDVDNSFLSNKTIITDEGPVGTDQDTNISTNIFAKPMPEPFIPNTYLSSGKIVFTPTESFIRRYDIVFFVAIPVAFYLTMNLLELKNQVFYQDNGFIRNADYNYMYLSTLVIPLTIAFNDSVYFNNWLINQENSENNLMLNIQIPLFAFN